SFSHSCLDHPPLPSFPTRRSSDLYARSRHEPALDPRLVEPGRLDLARLVRDLRRQDLQAAPPPAGARAHRPLDHGLLVADRGRDALAWDRRLVPPWPLPEEIAHPH